MSACLECAGDGCRWCDRTGLDLNCDDPADLDSSTQIDWPFICQVHGCRIGRMVGEHYVRVRPRPRRRPAYVAGAQGQQRLAL